MQQTIVLKGEENKTISSQLQKLQSSTKELLEVNKIEEKHADEELNVSFVNKVIEYKSLVEKSEREHKDIEAKYKSLLEENENGKQTILEKNHENQELKASLANKELEYKSSLDKNAHEHQALVHKLKEAMDVIDEKLNENNKLLSTKNEYQTIIAKKDAAIEMSNEKNLKLNEDIKTLICSKDKEIEDLKMKWTEKKDNIATYPHKLVMVNEDVETINEQQKTLSKTIEKQNEQVRISEVSFIYKSN